MIKTAVKAAKPATKVATAKLKIDPLVGASGHIAGTDPLAQVDVQGEVVASPQKPDGRGLQPGSKSTYFAVGNNANPGGKPAKSRNRLQGTFLRTLADDFEVNGKQAIVTMRLEKPAEYIKVIASLMPKEVEITTTPLDEMTDDQIDQALAALKQLANDNTVVDVDVKELS